MYVKLALRNARRSISDYLVYIVTLTICVTLFYAFLSITSGFYHPDIGAEFDLTALNGAMRLAICLVTLLILFLIRYVNRFMLRRRQKEFAIQTVMGMERNTTAWLFFAETVLMGALSVGLGIVCGAVCSQFITAMLLTSYGKPFRLSWMLFPDTVFLTVCFFAAGFLAVGMTNVRTIQKIKVIDMLCAERENDGSFKKSLWMPVMTGVYGVMLLVMLREGIFNLQYDYDARFALAVRIMFWGNVAAPAVSLAVLGAWGMYSAAVRIHRRARVSERDREEKSRGLSRVKKQENAPEEPAKNGDSKSFGHLVVILLFCALANACMAANVPGMRMRYMLGLDDGAINQYLLYLLANLGYLICAFFYLAGGALTALKEKVPKLKYREENLFFFGQILSKLKTTTKTMTLICMTLSLSCFVFAAAAVLAGWAEGYLEMRAVYDIQISFRYNDVYEFEDLSQEEYALVTEFLEEKNVEVKEDRSISVYLPRKEEFHNRSKYDFPVTAISLTDYNALRRMQGEETVALEENEFLTQWKSIAIDEEIDEFTEKHRIVETDAGSLMLAAEGVQEASLGEMLYNSYVDVLYVFPDSACKKLLCVGKNRYINMADPLSVADAVELEQRFENCYPEAEEGVHYYIRMRTLQVNESKASVFVLKAAMNYGAVVLFVICFTILSQQQLLDAAHYRYRFGVLKKMGVEEERLDRLILKQLAVWFGMPVSVALVVAGVLVVYLFHMISAEISAYIGFGQLLAQVGMTAGILAFLLLCYFVSTWVLFRRMAL